MRKRERARERARERERESEREKEREREREREVRLFRNVCTVKLCRSAIVGLEIEILTKKERICILVSIFNLLAWWSSGIPVVPVPRCASVLTLSIVVYCLLLILAPGAGGQAAA